MITTVVQDIWANCRKCGNPSQLVDDGTRVRVLDCANPFCEFGKRTNCLHVKIRGPIHWGLGFGTITQMHLKRIEVSCLRAQKPKPPLVITRHFAWSPDYNS